MLCASYLSCFLVPAVVGYLLSRELSLVFSAPKWLGEG